MTLSGNAFRRRPSFVESLESRRLLAFADIDPAWGDHGIGVNARVFYEQADGKILASDAQEQTRHLVRLNADGSYDTGFSHDGKVPFSANIVAARQVAGNIVVAYTYSRRSPGQSNSVYTGDDDYVYGYGVARFTARGAVDTTFGNDGNNAIAFHTSKIGSPDLGGVAIDADGSVYFGISGDSLSVLSSIKFTSFVLKFNAQGQRDSTYGSNGVVTLPSDLRFGHRDFVRTIASLELADGGPLLIGGTEIRFDVDSNGLRGDDGVDNAAASSFVTRLTRSGAVDTGFATAGTFKVDKLVSNHSRDDGESAEVIRQKNGHVLLVTRVDGKLRVFTLTAGGRAIASKNGVQDDTVGDDHAEIQFAEQLANGSLIVVRTGVLFELRPTDSGYVAQPPMLPAGSNGRPIDVGSYFANTLLPLRDGSVLLSYFAASVKISAGDGQTPRDDGLPFGRQNSITTPDNQESNDNYAIGRLDAFYHDERGGLKFRRRDTAGRWGDVQTVDPAAGAGIFLSAVGTNVVYTDGGTADLKFAKRLSNGRWATETIDRGGATGFFCSLVATSANTLAVAYYNRTRGDLRLARRSADGRWTIETVDRAGNVGRYAKLITRLDGGLSIAYATHNTSGFRLADEKAGVASGGWTFTDLATGGVDVAGLDADYFLTNNDPEPYGPSEQTTTVAVYDASAGDLVVAYRPTAKGTFSLVRETSTGDVGLNPHVSHFQEGVVSFYDKGRNQVRTTRIVENETGFGLETDPMPTIASAGAFANPVKSYEEPNIQNGYAGGGYTSIYAWLDDSGVLKVRGPA